MYIAQTEVDGQVWFDLPRIAAVQQDAIVRPQSASGKAKCRLLRREAQAIAHDYQLCWIIQRVGGPAGKWRRCRIKCRRIGIHRGRQTEETGKAAALNVVIANSVTYDMRTYRPASVILGLNVLLIGLLRGKRVGSGTESVSAIQTGGV